MAKSVFDIDNSYGGGGGNEALNPFDNGVFNPLVPPIKPTPGIPQQQLGSGGGTIAPGTDPAGLYYTTHPAPQTSQAQQGGNPTTNSGGGGGSPTVPSGPSTFFSGWNTYQPKGFNAGSISQTSPLAGLTFGTPPPTYQAYTFTNAGLKPTVTGTAPPIAGLPNRTSPAAYTAGTFDPFKPGGANYDTQLQQLIANMMANQQPNAAALKEASKETMLKTNQDNLEQMMQSAAGRGTLGGGVELGNELRERQDFAGNLTKSYRDIDLAAQQQGFDNAVTGGTFLGNLGASQAKTAQDNYYATLAGQKATEDARIAAANSALAVQTATDDYNKAKAQHELAVAQYGLDYANVAFGQQLQSAQYTLEQQKAQAQQAQVAAQLALDQYLGIGDLNLRKTTAQSGDEVNRFNANWQAGLGGAEFGLKEQGFGLDLQQAAFQEWLAKQNLGLQGRGLDLTQSGQEQSAAEAYWKATHPQG